MALFGGLAGRSIRNIQGRRKRPKDQGYNRTEERHMNLYEKKEKQYGEKGVGGLRIGRHMSPGDTQSKMFRGISPSGRGLWQYNFTNRYRFFNPATGITRRAKRQNLVAKVRYGPSFQKAGHSADVTKATVTTMENFGKPQLMQAPSLRAKQPLFVKKRMRGGFSRRGVK